MQISIEEAYREAVTALGEALVMERLLRTRLAQAEARVADLEAEPVSQDPEPRN